MSKLQKSQLNNAYTLNMYLRQCVALAENVFKFDNIPELIDMKYVNEQLLYKGRIAWFVDKEINSLLALPFTTIGKNDLYNRPRAIRVYGKNGYYNILENRDDFVIMYDNYGMYSLYLDIIQYALRLSSITRAIDINCEQQKTPRIWQTSSDMETTLRGLLNNIDGNVETIVSYTNLLTDKINAVLQPAPFVSDKLQDEKEKIWNEFLRVIGIANVTFQKKERNIRDEIMASQGGTIASRFVRFEPRKDAINLINERFGEYLKKPIEVSYYDGLPTNMKDFESEVFKNDSINSNISNVTSSDTK